MLNPMATIAVLDYGFGSVLGLTSTFQALGVDVVALEHGATLHAYDAAILPGTGPFGQAMRALESVGMFSALWNFYEEVRKPILGIGLGMQMLASGSAESPGQPGLSLLPGTARSFGSSIPRPYVGWNRVQVVQDDWLFEGVPDGSTFHFNQDYYILPTEDERHLTATYHLGGDTAVAAMRKGAVWSVQFDPVKSGEVGQQVLANFARLVERVSPTQEAGAQ